MVKKANSTRTNTRRFIGENVFGKMARTWVKQFGWFLPPKAKILDLGCGTCMISRQLINQGYRVTSVDVQDKSYYPDIRPIVYNGKILPFKNNEFDVCLLLAVLHHTENTAQILSEAARVSRKIIILEDLIDGPWQRRYTYTVDRILNQEFLPPPHHNKSDHQWRSIFKDQGLKLVKSDYRKIYLFVHHGMYYLEK